MHTGFRFLWLGRPLRVIETAFSSWGWTAAAAKRAETGEVEPVRQAMRALAAATPGIPAARLGRLINRCGDLQSLWHLRSSLMQVLAAAGGEVQARRQMAGIDAAFRAAWPEAPVTRGGPLG